MKLTDSINMSLDDLKNRKLRTFLTCLSIAIGTMLVILLGGLGQGLQKWGMDQVNNMAGIRIVSVEPIDINKKNLSKNKMNNKEFLKKIEKKDIQSIKNIKGVDSIRAELQTNVTGTTVGNTKGKKSKLLGIDSEYATIFNSEKNKVKDNKKNENKNKEPIIAGRMIKKGEQKAVLVGERYLNKIGIKDYKSVIGKDIDLKVEIPNEKAFSVKGKVIGVINRLYNESGQIIVPMDMAAKIQEFNIGESNYLDKHGVSRLLVEVKTIEDAKSIQSKVEKLGYQATSQMDAIDSMQGQMKVLNALLMAGGVIVLLVSSMGVINTMSMSILEKTKSIGIMKAVGASKKNIKRIFLVQSGTIGFLGGLLGIVMTFIASNGINVLMKNLLKKGNIDKLIIIPTNLVIIALGLAVVISIIAGLVPSSRAAKLDPVETLSYE